MVAEWYIELARVGRKQFRRVVQEIGLTSQRGTYYDSAKCIEVRLSREGLASRLTIRGNENGYEAMRSTTLDLGTRLPFITITGDGFDQISDEPLSYIPSILDSISFLI